MASVARATSLRRSPTSSDKLRLCFTSIILPGCLTSVKFLLRGALPYSRPKSPRLEMTASGFDGRFCPRPSRLLLPFLVAKKGVESRQAPT